MALPEFARQSVKQGSTFLLTEERTIFVQKVRAGNKAIGEAAQMVEYTINDEAQAPRAVYEFKKWVWENKVISQGPPPPLESDTISTEQSQQQQHVEPITTTVQSVEVQQQQPPNSKQSWWSTPNWMDDVFDFFFK